MSHTFHPVSTPPPGGPPPPYGALAPGYGPPPGYGAPPPKKSSTATVILIVLTVVFGGGIFVVAILAAILFPVFAKVRGNARLAACEAGVRQIGLGLTQYTYDNNNRFPTGDYKQAIMPYIKSETVFHCPADVPGNESYSFNSKLQGVSLNKIKVPVVTVAVYEGANQTLDFRHEHTGGNVAVVGFVDGHVRAISQSQAQSLRWKP